MQVREELELLLPLVTSVTLDCSLDHSDPYIVICKMAMVIYTS